MPEKAIIMDKKDNVATTLCRLEKGNLIQLRMEDYAVNITLSQDIPLGHKFALKDIPQGEAVTKYGEVIGLATKQIRQGNHVHVHNVESQRGRGDKQ